MSGRYTIEPGAFASLSFEVVLPHEAHEHGCERSHVRMQPPGFGAVALNETRESFEVRRVGDSPLVVAFNSAAEALKYGHDIAGDHANASVEVWRIDRLGARSRVVSFRSRIEVTAHWHDSDFAGLDR